MASTARTLVLLRHAKSAWPPDTPDVERDLAPRGRRDAPAVGRWLRRNVPSIDLAVCSPAVRARQTWQLAGAQLDTVPPSREDERLYGASVDDLLEVTRELPGDVSTVVLIGHNPGLEQFLELMSGEVRTLKTSAIAVLDGIAGIGSADGSGEAGGAAPGDGAGWAHAAGPGTWTLRTLEIARGD